MAVFAELLIATPASIATAAVVLRYGPTALITLVAGVVAVLARDPKRGERALAVLRAIRHPSVWSRRRVSIFRANKPDRTAQ